MICVKSLMMKYLKKLVVLVLAATLCFSLAACADASNEPITVEDYGEDFTTLPLTDNGYELEEIVIEIPGLTEEYNLLLVADLHIIEIDNGVEFGQKSSLKNRIKAFSLDNGKTTSSDLWEAMPVYLDACNADAILFAGDMVDFSSESNNRTLLNGLEKLKTPYLLVKADHDTEPFVLNDKGMKTYDMYQDQIGNSEALFYSDLGEVVIICVNYSTTNLPDSAVETLREAVAIGKPIIILTHVPFYSEVDNSLQEMSEDDFGGRALVWSGYGNTDYYPGTDAQWELMTLIYTDDNPVREVLCGHLHFSWDGSITNYVDQHVFSPAFEKKIGYIRICGSK